MRKPADPFKPESEQFPLEQQMLLDLASAKHLLEVASIASLLGAIVIYLVLKHQTGD